MGMRFLGKNQYFPWEIRAFRSVFRIATDNR